MAREDDNSYTDGGGARLWALDGTGYDKYLNFNPMCRPQEVRGRCYVVLVWANKTMMQIQLFREKLSTTNAITAFNVINALEKVLSP